MREPRKLPIAFARALNRWPAARGQAPENRVARGLLIKVHGLRIELGREGPGALRVDAQPARAENLPDFKVFEIALSHFDPLRDAAGAARCCVGPVVPRSG